MGGDTLAFGDLSATDAAGLNFLFFNTFSGDDFGQSTTIHAKSGAHDAGTLEIASNILKFASHGLVVGDTVQIAHGSNVYVAKVINVATNDVTFDRDVGTSATGAIYFTKVTASPCTVEETTKGTSELLECSGRGLCDDIREHANASKVTL